HRLYNRAYKYAILRSMVGAEDRHDAVQCLTGRTSRNQPPGGWPCLGSVLAKLEGPLNQTISPHIRLSPKMGHMEWARSGDPGFLGAAYAPFQPNKGGGKEDRVLNGITLDRL